MQFETTDELARELIRLRLVTDAQVAACHQSQPVTSDPGSLLTALEVQHFLTAYQAGKLRSGEKAPLVLGAYKLQYQNASGSFARVFRGASLDPTDDRMIGIKVLRQRFLDDPKAVRHFHREAELCMKLQHPNVVPLFDVGTDDDWHYFTMEFIEGGNLRDFIRIRNKLDPVEVLRCGCDMAEGLRYAMTLGISHRDFKMSNVLMTTRGVAKLVDFGLAGDASTGSDESVHAIEYATLEKNTHAPINDPRSDLFFLGAILYELSSGVCPWKRTADSAQRKQFSRYSGVRPLHMSDPNTPRVLADIIDRLLRVNPDERYQSAEEALVDLRPALAEFGDSKQAIAGQPADGQEKRPNSIPTVLCVEYRPKQQDLLREYLAKHGFRVLMLSSWERALTRIRNNPPDGLVLMGDALDAGHADAYDEALRWSKLQNIGCVVVLRSGEQGFLDQLTPHAASQVLTQPTRLRDVRSAMLESLAACQNRE
jgi:serine/threonine protein kinase